MLVDLTRKELLLLRCALMDAVECEEEFVRRYDKRTIAVEAIRRSKRLIQSYKNMQSKLQGLIQG